MSKLVIGIGSSWELRFWDFKFCLSKTRQLHTFEHSHWFIKHRQPSERKKCIQTPWRLLGSHTPKFPPAHLCEMRKRLEQLKALFWVLKVLYHSSGSRLPVFQLIWHNKPAVPAAHVHCVLQSDKFHPKLCRNLSANKAIAHLTGHHFFKTIVRERKREHAEKEAQGQRKGVATRAHNS